MNEEDITALTDLFAWHSEQVEELDGKEGEETALAFHSRAVRCLYSAMLTLREEGRNGLQGRN